MTTRNKLMVAAYLIKAAAIAAAAVACIIAILWAGSAAGLKL